MNSNDISMILWHGKCFTCSAVLSTFVLLTYLVVSHVGLGSVQQSFKFQSICVPIRYDVAHLADDSGEDEDAYQVTYDSEHVPGG